MVSWAPQHHDAGIDTEDDYPYTAQDGQCDLGKRDRHVVTIDDYQDVPANDEKSLLKVCAGWWWAGAGFGAAPQGSRCLLVSRMRVVSSEWPWGPDSADGHLLALLYQ